MKKVTRYVFVATNKSSCRGCYYPEDDWSEMVHGESLEDLKNKAAALCGSFGFNRGDNLSLYSFDCIEDDGKLYGQLFFGTYYSFDKFFKTNIGIFI